MSRPPLGSTLDILGLSIPWYSLLMMTAVAIGIWLAMREERRIGLPKDTVLNFALLAIPLGIIGARLYYVAFTWSRFSGDLLEIFRVWNGGLALYGSVLGGILAAVIVTRKGKTSLPTLLDISAPSLILGQAIGRWGNYANMEAYGARIYNEALQFFPLAVEIPIVSANGTEYWYWHMAAFFYESMWDILVFAILMKYRKKMWRSGDVTCWYLLLYCAGRTIIEGLRDDSLMLNIAAAQIRVSQILSAVVCVGVLVLLFVRLLKLRKPHLAEVLCGCLIVLGIACTFISEFERNAYQMLFVPAQILLGLMLVADVVFFVHYTQRAKRLGPPGVWMLIAAALCALTLVLGIGRLGEGNTGYIVLRQSVAMIHLILTGAWLYLRTGAPRERKRPAMAKEAA